MRKPLLCHRPRPLRTAAAEPRTPPPPRGPGERSTWPAGARRAVFQEDAQASGSPSHAVRHAARCLLHGVAFAFPVLPRAITAVTRTVPPGSCSGVGPVSQERPRRPRAPLLCPDPPASPGTASRVCPPPPPATLSRHPEPPLSCGLGARRGAGQASPPKTLLSGKGLRGLRPEWRLPSEGGFSAARGPWGVGASGSQALPSRRALVRAACASLCRSGPPQPCPGQALALPLPSTCCPGDVALDFTGRFTALWSSFPCAS